MVLIIQPKGKVEWCYTIYEEQTILLCETTRMENNITRIDVRVHVEIEGDNGNFIAHDTEQHQFVFRSSLISVLDQQMKQESSGE